MSEETDKKSTSTDPAESIYSGIRHTVSMAITYEDGQKPDEWYDLDFRSPNQDVELALEEYLQATFGEDVEMHHEDNMIYVDEPEETAAGMRRYYRANV